VITSIAFVLTLFMLGIAPAALEAAPFLDAVHEFRLENHKAPAVTFQTWMPDLRLLSASDAHNRIWRLI